MAGGGLGSINQIITPPTNFIDLWMLGCQSTFYQVSSLFLGREAILIDFGW
jgi:hypothetical protein